MIFFIVVSIFTVPHRFNLLTFIFTVFYIELKAKKRYSLDGWIFRKKNLINDVGFKTPFKCS